jgi:transposase
LACQKPVALGYPNELWTQKLLAKHVRENCEATGHPSLRNLAPSTVCKLLAKRQVRPHKIQYYLERRDPDFDTKMAQVLHVYKEVAVYRSTSLPEHLSGIISYDEKPGIQAIENTAPDLPPVPGKHPCISRDHEYVRHGTVTLMAGIDLVTGQVHSIVRDRHRTTEFIEFLNVLDAAYPTGTKVRIILDNHSAHVSKALREYLATKPNRFDFVFTPKHGSWLNIVEAFFAKMANSMLRGIRVASKQELVSRIEQYITNLNEDPVIFRWKYKIDETSLC